MKTSLVLFCLLLLLLIALTGCAPGANQLKGTAVDHGRAAGFWLGVWHGFIAPFVFVISLFRSDLNIYETHSNGAWYNLGFLFGIACFFGGGGNKTARRKI